MASRIYKQQETERLIRRAVEMETNRAISPESDAPDGLTLEEISAIAAESGIDPEFIRRAADELDPDRGNEATSPETQKPRKPVKQRGDEIYFEKWLTVKTDPEMLDTVITDLNHRFAHEDELEDMPDFAQGYYKDIFGEDYDDGPKVTKTGSSIEWRGTDYYGMYETRVLLQPRGDKLRIRVSKRSSWGASWSDNTWLIMYILPVFLTIGGFTTYSVWDNAWTGIFAAAIFWAATYPLMKKLAGRSINKHNREIQQLGEELCEMIDFLSTTEADPGYQSVYTGSPTSKKASEKSGPEPKKKSYSSESTRRLRNDLRG